MDINKKRILIIFSVIVLLGTFLRFYKLGEISFEADEFLDINATYGYAQTGEWQAWDFNLEQPSERVNIASDQRAWLYRWQVATVFKYFPPTEATARSASVLWGVITMILIYFIAKYFTQRKYIGLISVFLFAVSIAGIIFDRKLRMYAMFFPVFMAFSWMTYRFLEEDYRGKVKLIKTVNDSWGLNLVYFFPAIILGLLSLHLHFLTASIVIVLVVYFIIRAIIVYKSQRSIINKYIALFLLIILGLAGGNIFTPQIINKFTGGLRFFNDNYSYFSKIFVDYSHPLIAIIFLALGVYYIYKIQKLSKEATWLATSFFVTLLFMVFIGRRNVGPQYIFFIQSFEIILIASGIYYVAKFFRDNLTNTNKKICCCVSVALALLILPNYGYFFQENNAYRQNSDSENPRYQMIFEYFKKKKSNEDVLVTRDFRNYYWSGEKVKTYDFGGEVSKNKLTAERLQEIINENASGWVIYSDNDESYISKNAENYIINNMEKINAIPVRGKVSVYRWGN